jgi:steroid 5-alpha reductase family enzyme
MIETLLFALGLNTVLFLVAYKFQTDKLTDISYALTFFSIGLYGVLTNDMSPAKWLVFALVAAWAVRLGSFLLYRIHKMGKDRRFDQWRKSFWKFGRFWIGQGFAAWAIMLAASLLFQVERNLQIDTVVLVGAAVALSGLLTESIADWQKFKFNQDKKNKGKWIAEGIWKYSRHPNYFGEIVMWYGVYLMSYTFLSDINVWVAAISPITITIVLLGLSGIPILEKSADKRWGKDKKYQEYKMRTSILVPLPRRKLSK